MLALHRAGHIELPAPRQVPPNPLAQRSKPCRWPWRPSRSARALKDLLPLTFRQVRRTEEERSFNGLIEAHHYLGYTQPVGEHLEVPGLLGGSAAGLPGLVVARRGTWVRGTGSSAGRRSSAAGTCASWPTTRGS